MQTDRRENTTDGPMLNYVAVFQVLCLKVTMDKVDPFYPFHPKSHLDLKNDTRINSASQELEAWVGSLSKFNSKLLLNPFP